MRSSQVDAYDGPGARDSDAVDAGPVTTVDARLADGARDGGDSPAMERPHVSPVEARIQIGIDLRRCSES